MRGNCYVTSEALYHLLGGRLAGWKPMRLRLPWGETHWYLRHHSGVEIDATRSQFTPTERSEIDWSTARGAGFLTKQPSKRARVLMDQLVWQ